MNDKNRLQEYCQKKGLRLPIYDSWYDNKRGIWVTRTHVLNDEEPIETVGRTKVDAEQVGADFWLKMLLQRDARARKSVTSKVSVVVYIDMENINVNEMRDLFSCVMYDTNKFKFVGFLSDNHHHAKTVFEFEGINFRKIIVPSALRDAVDIGMIMYIMNAECAGVGVDVIVSRDKFSHAFHDLASKGFCEYGNVVMHASCIKSMETCLYEVSNEGQLK